MDYLSSDRHPTLALFIDCPPRCVDVNVHPAKAEVRFADPGLVRGLVVGALKQSLAEALHRATPSNAMAAAQRFAQAAARFRAGRAAAKLGLARLARRAGPARRRRLCRGRARRRRAGA